MQAPSQGPERQGQDDASKGPGAGPANTSSIRFSGHPDAPSPVPGTQAPNPHAPSPIASATPSPHPVPQADDDPHARRGLHTGPTYAALDLGTNNCRLLVARPSRRGFKVIDAFSRIIRLGEGVTATGELGETAMNRTLQALQVCAAKMARHKVDRSRLVATEACRLARNAPEFLARVERDLGLDIEILSHEDEARLAVSGCASLIDNDADLVLVFDIGGGSSELIWLDLSGHGNRGPSRSLADRVDVQNAILAWTSLPVGVVTLAERLDGRFIARPEFEDMVAYVSKLVAPFEAKAAVNPMMGKRRVHLLGTSGTVTTVAGVHLGLPHYDRSRVDGCWISSSDVRTVTNRLLDANYDERVAEPCIGRERADLVLAGCAILEALLRTWPCERLRVADRGLREGILASLMSDDARRGRSPR